jgi:hypothetical protein
MNTILRVFCVLLFLLGLNWTTAVPVSASNTSVSIDPASLEVDNGDSFTLDIRISTDLHVVAWSFDSVYFDATKMQCTGVAEGDFLKSYAESHGGSTQSNPARTLVIDNDAGIITNLCYFIMGISEGPTGDGVLATLSFTANDGVDSAADVTMVFGQYGCITDIDYEDHFEDVTGQMALLSSVMRRQHL